MMENLMASAYQKRMLILHQFQQPEHKISINRFTTECLTVKAMPLMENVINA
jgi:hypothetical protein